MRIAKSKTSAVLLRILALASLVAPCQVVGQQLQSATAPAPVVTATDNKQITFQTLSSYEFHQKLRFLFGENYVVQFGNPVSVANLRLPGSKSILRMNFHATGKIDIVGQSSEALQTARMLSILDLSASAAGSVRSVVVRRSGLLDRGELPLAPASTSSRDRTHLIQPVQFEEALPNASKLDPAIRKRLRDLGENVQVEVLPELDVIVLRGRDKDIDDLAQIIKELERAAEDAQSKIEIVRLQHARDEAVAELVDQMSEQYTGARQGRVTLAPLTKPNAVLVVGWGQAFDATLELIRKLDQAVPPGSQLQVFQLRYAAASTAAQTITDFYANRTNLGAKVVVSSDQRTNALIVHAAPRDLAEVQQLVNKLDQPRGQATNNKMQVFQLTNSLATDVATLLQTALTGDASESERNAALEIMMVDQAGRQRILSANLDGVRVTPDINNNSIIVAANAELMSIVEQLIRQMDAARTPSQIKLFRIVHGDASTLVTVLRSLLISNATGASRLPNAAAASSLAPLRFAVELRTNSIIASGPAEDLRIVEALLSKLDEGESSLRTNAVYHLKNAPAVDVANTINQFLASKRQIEATAAGGVSAQLQLDKEVVVVPEPVNNKLILSATPRYFDELHELIQRLDEPPPQVVIQVLIAEVTLSNTEEFGVELGLQDSVLFDRSLLGDLVTTVNSSQTSDANGVVTITEEIIQSATNTPGFNFNNFPLGNSGSTQALNGGGTLAGQGLSNFAVGRVNNELGFGGLVISASSQNVNLLIRALQESQRIEVLSRPQVRTLDNQPAYIQVGQRVPQITSSSITQFGQTNAIAFSDVGLILGVTPRISPDNTVVMEIDAEKSSVAAQDGVPISALADGTVIRAPIFNSTRAQSTVSAASGETIVLAGLITKDNATIDRGVPYLSDLPLLGNLFRYDSSNSVRTELLIILTPHIIRGQEDSERVKQAELARMSWCAADVYEVHGDINYNFEDQSMMLEEEAVETIYPDQEGFPATDQPLVSPGVIQNASAGLRRPAPTAPRRPAPAEVRVAGRRKR